MSNKMEVSIILPTYNEIENIQPLVSDIIHSISNINYEIIIVDDNSPDGTGEEAKKLEQNYPNVKTIIRTEDKGLAKSIKEGILSSKGGCIVIMDTDFSHPPEVIPRLLESIKENDLVLASRYIKGGSMVGPIHKFFLSKSLNKTLGLILGLDIKDLTGGFFAIKKEILNDLDLNKIFQGSGDYFFKLSCVLKKQNTRIKEIPFRYGERKYGSSKTILIKIGIDYIIQALKIMLKND